MLPFELTKDTHTSPFRASYGVSFMSTSTEIDRVIKGFYCISNGHQGDISYCTQFIPIPCVFFQHDYDYLNHDHTSHRRETHALLGQWRELIEENKIAKDKEM